MLDTKSSISKFWHSISIEPAIFLWSFSTYVVTGVELLTNMMLWKVCRYELGYNETICENLDLDENEDYQIDVQQVVNNFQMVRLH